MTVNQRLSDSICRHEGMLLSPQHFQQNHIYWEQQIHRTNINRDPNFWGIQYLDYDEKALSEGTLKIERLLCTMPDGTLVDYDCQEQSPLEILFKDSLALNQSGRIYLTIPVRLDGAASDKAAIRRYISFQDSPKIDDNTGDGAMVIHRLQPILGLHIGDIPGKQYVSLALMEVWRPENGVMELTHYCPPTSNLLACSFLKEHSPLQKSHNLAFEIRKRARNLAGIVGDGNESLGAAESPYQRQRVLAIVKALPELELLLDYPMIHPFDLYRTLARVVGAFSELNADLVPPKLPAYQHTEISDGVLKALEFLRTTIEEINLNYTSTPFSEEQHGMFNLQFDKAWKGRCLFIEIRPAPNVTAEQTESWMAAGCVASVSQQRDLHNKRMSGAEVVRIPSGKEGSIQARSGNLLFRVEDSPYILPGQKLLIRLMNNNLKSANPKRIFLHVPHKTHLDS